LDVITTGQIPDIDKEETGLSDNEEDEEETQETFDFDD
jgi:hypothetical protein